MSGDGIVNDNETMRGQGIDSSLVVLISVTGRGRSGCQVGEESDRRSRYRLLVNIFRLRLPILSTSQDQLTRASTNLRLG